jgi:hypothetical protein
MHGEGMYREGPPSSRATSRRMASQQRRGFTTWCTLARTKCQGTGLAARPRCDFSPCTLRNKAPHSTFTSLLQVQWKYLISSSKPAHLTSASRLQANLLRLGKTDVAEPSLHLKPMPRLLLNPHGASCASSISNFIFHRHRP